MTETALRQKFDRQHLMIMCAPNGARRGKQDHPDIPLSASEIATEAQALARAGVSVLHLHVRDSSGGHTLDAETYRTAMDAIVSRPDAALVIQVTSESVGTYSSADQMAMVRDLRPQAVSLALAELCPDEAAEEKAGVFFQWAASQGIWMQFIVYSPEQLLRLDRMRQAGLLGSDYPSCLLVLGSYLHQREGTVTELDNYQETGVLPGFSWAACCFGRSEQDMMLEVARRGGHVRLGFENNLQFPQGETAGNNADLISAFVARLGDAERKIATTVEIHSNFGLEKN